MGYRSLVKKYKFYSVRLPTLGMTHTVSSNEEKVRQTGVRNDRLCPFYYSFTDTLSFVVVEESNLANVFNLHSTHGRVLVNCLAFSSL
jgi:hypothetical protein